MLSRVAATRSISSISSSGSVRSKVMGPSSLLIETSIGPVITGGAGATDTTGAGFGLSRGACWGAGAACAGAISASSIGLEGVHQPDRCQAARLAQQLQEARSDGCAVYAFSGDQPTWQRDFQPHATGVIEGACRHLVKDRCELSGMRWSQPGAEALLGLRSVAENGDWEAFHAFRRNERQRRFSGMVLSQEDSSATEPMRSLAA